jgi:hypothetical protein
MDLHEGHQHSRPFLSDDVLRHFLEPQPNHVHPVRAQGGCKLLAPREFGRGGQACDRAHTHRSTAITRSPTLTRPQASAAPPSIRYCTTRSGSESPIPTPPRLAIVATATTWSYAALRSTAIFWRW